GGGALRGGLGRLLGETRPHDDRYREGLTRGFAGGIHAEDGADREDPVLLWQDLDAVEDRNALHGALGGRDLAAGDELEPVPDLDLAGDPVEGAGGGHDREVGEDRKSTRLNSSHVAISYAVFCLKKKTKQQDERTP